jgi:orotate phosphoribosyltransferase
MNDVLVAAGLLHGTDAPAFFRTGHVRYESGDHGDLWLALDLLFVDPRRLRHVAGRLADKLRPHAPEVVCGPLVGGALLGQWVAHDLGAAFVVAAPEPTTGGAPPAYAVPTVLRTTVRGRRVAIVDDAVNMGAATLGAARAVEASDGQVVAVGALLVRTPGPADAWPGGGLPVESLVGLPWNVWPPDACPLCRAGVPLDSGR